jgi:uncharacterized metal-binding protein YceD (DUF177 family)
MVINIQRIPEGRSALSQLVKIEGEQGEWLTCSEDLNCRAEIDRIQPQITVHLFFQGSVVLECSRCLSQFSHPINGEFYVLLKKRSAEKKHKVPFEDDVDFYFDDNTEDIDIRSAIFDDIITNLPLKPICSDECPGILVPLKPSKLSGQGANEGKSIDPRWDALKKLKKKK